MAKSPKTPARATDPMTTIHVPGAREHNLTNVDLEISSNALVVFTGLPSCGAFSLACTPLL